MLGLGLGYLSGVATAPPGNLTNYCGRILEELKHPMSVTTPLNRLNEPIEVLADRLSLASIEVQGAPVD